ncbi:MAG TPA: hypothetical protein VHA57_10775, partial [Actinomycetota bacterium]|nr:hypothetical protein [Actinomycetota bacterium]
MGTRQFRRGRLFAVFACLSLIGPFIAVQVVASQVAAAAATASISIGIDNTTPSPCVSAPVGTLPPVCHNWTYDDYFPNGVTTPTITVHSGDVVAFNMSTRSPDALHTVTLLQPTETVTEALAAYPLAVPDTNPGEPAGQLELNPAVLSPTNPACGSSAATACPYDGSAHINSGALSPGAPPVYFQINAPAGTKVPFMCLIHPGMVGQLTVVTSTATASTQADLDTQATALYQTETAEAFAQESALTTAGAGHTTNPNGTTAWSVWAGANGLAAGGAPDPHVQLLEMLPSALTIKPGDTVTWTSTSLLEPHTITFPHSEATIGSAYDFAPQLCAGPTGPTPAAGPPPFFGCAGPPGSPTGFEVHLNPGPLGPTSITTPGTQATSGVIASFSLGGPVVSQTSFTFPTSNAISYQCTVHDHMYGAIYVAGAPGYRELAADGGVFAQGSSSFEGSTGSLKLNKPIVGGASTPDGKGYWA